MWKFLHEEAAVCFGQRVLYALGHDISSLQYRCRTQLAFLEFLVYSLK